MLPIRMTKLAPSEAISSVAASPVMAEKLRQLRNGGDITPKNAISASTTRIGSHMPPGAASRRRRLPRAASADGWAGADIAAGLFMRRSAACRG